METLIPDTPVVEDPCTRRNEIMNVLLRELNNCEQEERSIDKFNSMVRLSQTNTNHTISSFIQAMAESHDQRKRNTDPPPIIVKLPRTSLISRGNNTRTRLVTKQRKSSLEAKRKLIGKSKRVTKDGQCFRTIPKPRNSTDSNSQLNDMVEIKIETPTETIKSEACSTDHDQSQSLPFAVTPDAQLSSTLAPFDSYQSYPLILPRANYDRPGFENNEHHNTTYKLHQTMQLETGDEIFYITMSNNNNVTNLDDVQN